MALVKKHVYPRSFRIRPKNQKVCVTNEQNVHQNEFLGINRFFDHSHSSLYKFFWFLVVVTCISCCLCQIYSRLENYFEGTITVEVELRQQTSFWFPSVTICSTNVLRSVLQPFNETPFINTYQFWNEVSGIDVSDFVAFIPCQTINLSNCVKPIPDVMNVSYTTVVYGNCIILTLKNRTEYRGPFTTLDLIWNTTRAYKPSINNGFIFFIHNDSCKHVHDGMLISEEVLFSHATNFRIYAKELINLNSRRNPCVSVQEFVSCVNTCLDKKLAKELTCGLPLVNSSRSNQQCQDVRQITTNYKNMFPVFYSMTQHFQQCNCKRKCNEMKYTLHKDDEQILENDDITSLNLLYAEDTHQTVNEREMFTASALFSDIGGTIGLYLGISIFAIVDFVESLIRQARRSRNQHKFIGSKTAIRTHRKRF